MPNTNGEKVFTSWKEIASFFGKGVRTVQRWERKFGLPISRPTAAKNVVLATESELREWIRRSSSQLAADSESLHDGNANADSSLAEFALRLKRLEEDTARLSRIVLTFTERIEELSVAIPLSAKNSMKGGDGIKTVPVRPIPRLHK
jgi:phage terminase Nu1 subunit (DNA packaging protein)